MDVAVASRVSVMLISGLYATASSYLTFQEVLSGFDYTVERVVWVCRLKFPEIPCTTHPTRKSTPIICHNDW